MARVALATSADWPELWLDDQLIAPALKKRKVKAGPVIWDDESVDWSEYDLCVIRSTWDYPLRREEYLDWVERVAKTTPVLNPPSVLRWNTHKGYLRDLAAAGVPTVATEWLTGDGPTDLTRLVYRFGWDELVVKPAVSAGARDTLRARPGDLAEAEVLADTLLASGREVMVQPYVDTVDAQGELAVMVIDGEVSHTVRKPAVLVPGADALTQAEAVVPDEPSQRDLDVVEAVLAALPEPCLYVRVDLVHGADGAPMVLEIEATEPTLFLGSAEGAVDRFAAAVVARL